jgi:hypothetical protein
MNISSSLRPLSSPRFVVVFSCWGDEDPSISGSSADEEKRMNEEEAKIAEVLF